MNSILYVISGVIIGGGLGYLHWRFVGCKSGVCLITSNKYISTIYGAFAGFLLSTQLTF